MTEKIKDLLKQAAHLQSSAAAARLAGDERTADRYFLEAFGLAKRAADDADGSAAASDYLDILRVAVRLALECGEVAQGRRLMDEALAASGSVDASGDRAQYIDVAAWPDEWLVAAVRRDPADGGALDHLVDRYWRPLFGRCRLLILDHDKACDLAQQAWCRVLRARHDLKPGGNFRAYLMTVATNLWRDSHRAPRRAGALADHRLASLEEPLATDGDTGNLPDQAA